MWPYLHVLVPLCTVALASALCIGVVSFILGHSKPQAQAYGIHAKQIGSRLLVRKGGTVFSALSDRFERASRT
jgi:hypothetical protein